MPGEDKKDVKNSPLRRGRGIALFVLITILAGVGIWLWAGRSNEVSSNTASQVRSTLHLETFVLNLADADQRSYLRVGIDLGLSQELKRDSVAPVAEVRDTILGVLSVTKVDDLMSAPGKAKLKESLLHTLQQRIPQLGVEEVYFTEFLIQR